MKYIIAAFILFSCNNVTRQFEGTPVSTEILDTIKTVPAQISALPLLFETAFVKGTKEKMNKETLDLYGITIGKLKVVSGRIVACDPMLSEEYGNPFTQLFPIGEFPVQLSLAKLETDESIAFARINFNDEPVKRWEVALLEGQTRVAVDAKQEHGYVVDAGIAVFVDHQAVRSMENDSLRNELKAAMYKHFHNTWRYTMLQVGSHNLAAFSAGLGDGFYPTYIGFDANEKPCRLLTDFGLFRWKTLR